MISQRNQSNLISLARHLRLQFLTPTSLQACSDPILRTARFPETPPYGGVHDEGGIDFEKLEEWRREHGGGIAGFAGSRDVSNAELLELPCDVLVLAATENQVTGQNAGNVQAKLVAEGANGPTSLEGDEILAARGIPVLPDILTNAGGVAVSYFEWVQDIQRLFWGPQEIRSRLADLMADALSRVWELSESESLPFRRAALVTSIREVADALEARGIHP